MKQQPRSWVQIAFACILFLLLQTRVRAQKVEDYVNSLRDALAHNGAATMKSCHRLELDLYGPWGVYGLPDGVADGDFTWSLLHFDVRRAWIDLTALDADKLKTHAFYSALLMSHHLADRRSNGDTPTVMLFTAGINEEITVTTVDLEKVKMLGGRHNVPESELGESTDFRKLLIIPFADQEHATLFLTSSAKATIVCQAQQQ